MNNIDRRLSRLEAQRGGTLSLQTRAWLGHALTNDERAELAAMPAERHAPLTEDDMADWSPELRQWLKPGQPGELETDQ